MSIEYIPLALGPYSAQLRAIGISAGHMANMIRASGGNLGKFMGMLTSAFRRGSPTNAPSRTYIYRGVHGGHPEIANARRGIVRPGNVNGLVTEEAHNLGGVSADSPFTSWTTD